MYQLMQPVCFLQQVLQRAAIVVAVGLRAGCWPDKSCRLVHVCVRTQAPHSLSACVEPFTLGLCMYVLLVSAIGNRQTRVSCSVHLLCVHVCASTQSPHLSI